MKGFEDVPGWFAKESQGFGIATADLAGNGSQDLVVLVVDAQDGANRGAYRVGHGLASDGSVSGGWGPWLDVPDWFMFENQGADIAVADITGDGTPDLVVLAVDKRAEANRAVYRVGRGLAPDGQATQGWTPWEDVPFWFSWENQDAGVAVADLAGNGTQDLIVFTIDNGPQVNRGIFQVGPDLTPDGVVSGPWTGWQDVPNWFSWENQGVAISLVDRGGSHDLVVLAVDDPPQRNQAFYRTLPGVRADGTGTGPWGPLMGITGWLSWENQGAGLGLTPLDGQLRLVLGMVDAPPGATIGSYKILPYEESPDVHGRWETAAAHSGVLAIHAAMLPTDKVLFFAGSGNSQVRAAAHEFGDIAQRIYTSAVWDPITGQISHPDTIHGEDGHPFDFFCGGDTFLPDGMMLSAGGNLAYVAKGRRDVVAFDPATEQWQHRAPMNAGRWYPTLVSLQDGSVLTVSGLDQNAQLNLLFEIYSPDTDSWHTLDTPQQDLFFGLPLYPHLFLLSDGRVFFDGGRMDDASPQGPVVIDLTTQPLSITGVFGLQQPETRNQSASVLLPPAQDQRIMIIGGGPEDQTNGTGSTAIVDFTNPVPEFTTSEPMSLPRMHLNAVLLPDHTVFVSGGALAREEAIGARLQSEIYNPSEGTWHAAATAHVVRMYHSVALLLPDGRVVTAGGNPPPYGDQVPWEPADENEEMRLEIYSPPYMFRGSRPAIATAPSQITYQELFSIETPDADRIASACLIRPGVTTHAFDNSQRLVDLPVHGVDASHIQLTAPASSTLAPPGEYMLFVSDSTGIPSIANWIHLA